MAVAAERPSVGAIRWDAWSGGGVTHQVEQTLSPEAFRFRLPWFAEVDTQGLTHINGSAPGIMEQEIAYAKSAGLDYWAFLTYPEKDDMSSALAHYLASPRNTDLNFCLILHQTLSVPAHDWPSERQRILHLLQMANYQKVQGRPLLYTFDLHTDQPVILQRLQELLTQAHSLQLDPYLVWMGWNPSSDYRTHYPEGFAAVSAYAHPSEDCDFSHYVATFEQHAWGNALQTKTPYVPLVTTGWDKRPRQTHPVSWEKNAGYLTQKTFPATATPEAIAAHLKRAVRFTTSHPDLCPAQTIIIYAWNEHDEGGWLCPTWTPDHQPDTRRLDAIRKVLKP